MMKLQINLLVLLLICLAHLASAEMRMSQMVHEDKTQYEIRGNQGERAHKFGVEIVPNSQFHHTTTDEDGVRLGCYGHIQDGVLYSTLYVADKRGYRTVPNQGLIPVYPEYDEERQASFTDQFDINEQLSQNIRHFFPDGCKEADLIPQGTSYVNVQQKVSQPEQWEQHHKEPEPYQHQQEEEPEQLQQQLDPEPIQQRQQPAQVQPIYANRQPPVCTECRQGRQYEPTVEVTPATIIVPPPASTTTERPYPVYDRSKDPRYTSPSACPHQQQEEGQESMQLNVIELPPKCETKVQIYYFNRFVNQQNGCLQENCETVCIHLPIGMIYQNDLDQSSDIEILEKILEVMKKTADNPALKIMNQIRATE